MKHCILVILTMLFLVDVHSAENKIALSIEYSQESVSVGDYFSIYYKFKNNTKQSITILLIPLVGSQPLRILQNDMVIYPLSNSLISYNIFSPDVKRYYELEAGAEYTYKINFQLINTTIIVDKQKITGTFLYWSNNKSYYLVNTDENVYIVGRYNLSEITLKEEKEYLLETLEKPHIFFEESIILEPKRLVLTK